MPLTKAEIQKRYKERHPDRVKEQSHNYQKKKIDELREECHRVLGTKCQICGSNQQIEYHEIHGKRHFEKGLAKWRYIHKHSDDFIPLCWIHHRAVTTLSHLNEIQLSQLLTIVSKTILKRDTNG